MAPEIFIIIRLSQILTSRHISLVANMPRTTQGRSDENPNILSDGEPEISNIVNNVDVLDNQGN